LKGFFSFHNHNYNPISHIHVQFFTIPIIATKTQLGDQNIKLIALENLDVEQVSILIFNLRSWVRVCVTDDTFFWGAKKEALEGRYLSRRSEIRVVLFEGVGISGIVIGERKMES